MAVDLPALFRKRITSPRFEGDIAQEMKQAAREQPAEMLAEMLKLPSGDNLSSYPAWMLARHAERALATTPGIEPAETALRLASLPAPASIEALSPFILGRRERQRWILAQIAIRQPPDIALELLERNEERAAMAPLLAMLTAELVTRRRVRPADHAVVARILREMRGTGSPYASLPTETQPLESRIDLPALGDELFVPVPRLPPLEATLVPMRADWTHETLVELPAPPAPHEWPREGTIVELRHFHLPPGAAKVDLAGVIAGLPLQSLQPNARDVLVQAITPEDAFAHLFHLALVDEGWATSFAAWPRLVAWQLVAALSGCDRASSPEAIERAAHDRVWARVSVRGGWWAQIDLGWAAALITRDSSRLGVRYLAASRIEPRT